MNPDALRVMFGDCRETLSEIADGSVNCCVTSPPYFGLRDYGVDGQIGLEQRAPEQRAPEYVAELVGVFDSVRRVLRDDGVLFVNMGDTYAGFKDGKFPAQSSAKGDLRGLPANSAPHRSKKLLELDGFKDKELMGIPWRFALAMQDAGWYLRQDIIWSKPNYTPEKVRDRFVKSHEHIFMFTKKPKYWFDGEAVRVPGGDSTKLRPDVWTVPVSKYKGPHYATFPPELIEPCVLAGCPFGGTVIDPFGGTGTTAGVALAHGRKAIICELSAESVSLMPKRISEVTKRIKGEI
ncbi:putative DNA methylase N-4 [Shewanella phage SFCi1]|nr:putative DNA methylase N-4 [Shewanella phage SFCi1]